jgi:brefeldin A-inhibited guanine nucleotide-exchange protein
MLEMSSSTHQQKLLILQALEKICEVNRLFSNLLPLKSLHDIFQDYQTLADFYLNYDCDLTTISLFERIISVCCKVAQGKEAASVPQLTLMGLAASAAGFGSSQTELIRNQEKAIRRKGLLSLVALISALVSKSTSLSTKPLVTAPSVVAAAAESEREVNIGSTPILSADDLSKPGSATSIIADETRVSTTANFSEIPTVSTEQIVSNGHFHITSSLHSSAASTLLVAPISSMSQFKSPKDVLSATAQSTPVIVNKHHLSSLSMGGSFSPHIRSNSNVLYDDASGSGASSPTSTSSTISKLSTSAPAQIEVLTSRKNLLRRGIELFNRKPVTGLKYLIAQKFTEETPDAVAKFLRTNAGLSKSSIGEYLGDGDAFMIKVMHAFIDSLDFKNQTFVNALRSLLQTFRLPGESQKVIFLFSRAASLV